MDDHECPLCRGPFLKLGSLGPFTYCRCRACGFTGMAPTPEPEPVLALADADDGYPGSFC